jgi:hypothetical protein
MSRPEEKKKVVVEQVGDDILIHNLTQEDGPVRMKLAQAQAFFPWFENTDETGVTGVTGETKLRAVIFSRDNFRH